MRAIIKLIILMFFIIIVLANLYYFFDVSKREMINCESPVLIPMPKKRISIQRYNRHDF